MKKDKIHHSKINPITENADIYDNNRITSPWIDFKNNLTDNEYYNINNITKTIDKQILDNLEKKIRLKEEMIL